MKYLDSNGLLYYTQKVKGWLAEKVDKEEGKVLSSNDFTDALKNKLNGIPADAQKNVQSDWNITDSSDDAFIKNKPAIPTVPTKVSAFENDAKYLTQHQDISGKVDKVAGKGLSTNDFTTELKDKLEGIESGANKTVVDSALSATSTNPVQNKIVQEALNGKVDKVEGKGLSTNDYTTTEKNKLSGIATGATKTIVDASMSDNSTNPVQNKVVKSYVDSAIGGVTQFEFEVVSALPSTGVKGKIYLVAHTHGEQDSYDEYIWVTNKFEKIGNTDIDLSNYYNKGEVDGLLANKVTVESGKGLSTNDYTTAEKNKLAGIAEGANKTIVDTAISATSTNPVQNKVIHTQLAGKSDTGHKHTAADITDMAALTNAEIDTICG